MSRSTGHVTLVGAGPGDPELLTIKAMKAIAAADVLLVDDLVHDDVLAHAKRDARIVYVGKRGGCKSTPQAFIERLMVSEARAGHQVVRLKGGDPFVFGRGGEECLTLKREGVAYRVINGISAGLAAPTCLGIPLTHRDFCHGAIFVTGHAGDDAQSTPNWRALAATAMPLVIYMGIARVSLIVSELIAGGMRADMPVAVIQNATRSDQRAVVTTLDQLAMMIVSTGIGSPSILVIGETVSLASMDVSAVESIDTWTQHQRGPQQ